MKVPAWEAATPETIAKLAKVLSYDAQTGRITRTVKTGQNVVVGAEAGYECNGYRRIRACGRTWASHHIAWLLFYGRPANGLIDHINGNPLDNRISNLREASPSLNTQNLKRARRDNRLGLLGVRATGPKKFEARIMVNQRAFHLGTFETAELAHQAYLAAKRELHPGGTI